MKLDMHCEMILDEYRERLPVLNKIREVVHDILQRTLEENDMAVTAIEAADTEQTLRQAAGIYDATGRRQTTAHRGLNIVRMSDGTVRKVLVK